MRRFGCLVYILIQPRESVRKLEPKWSKAVFLGYSPNNSAWLVGTYAVDGRKADGVRWAEYETRDVKFVESVLIADLNRLWCQSPSWEI